MSFIAIKLFKLGYSQAKKQRAKKQQQQQFPESIYPQNPQNPQSYPMEYPPNLAPGSNISYPPKTSPPKRKVLPMLISALRFFQFVFGLAVIGLYGQDVQHDHAKHTWSAKWVFALIVGFLATLTAMIYMIVPFLRRASYSPGPAIRAPTFAWEFVLCVLWLTLFGIFGKMYIGVHEERVGLGDESKVNRMRHSVWVDLVNLGFWVVTASWVLLRWLKARRAVGEKEGEGEGEGV